MKAPSAQWRSRRQVAIWFIGIGVVILMLAIFLYTRPIIASPVSRKCLDADGGPLEINRLNFTGSYFMAKIPKGCAVLVIMPSNWPAYGWTEQQLGNDKKWQVYFKSPNGTSWQGPYGWNDRNGQLRLPNIFLMQGTQDNEESMFSIDRPKVQ